jgi:hypothetical protein
MITGTITTTPATSGYMTTWPITTPTRCPCCNRKAKPGFPFKYGWQYPNWTWPYNYQITSGSAPYTGPELTVYNNHGAGTTVVL